MTDKAKITIVSIGNLEIEGILFPDGSFGVSVPQIATLFQFTQNYASQSLKRLLGNGFSPHKISIENQKQKINVVSLLQFEQIVAKLDRAGNKAAQDFRDQLVGLSLQQLFSDAFGQKFDQEDRQAWLKRRQQGKIVRKSLTDSIKIYISRNEESLTEEYKKWIYAQCTDAIYLHIFNRRCKQLREMWNVEDKELFRDSLREDELFWIQEVEDVASRWIIRKNTEPLNSVNKIINLMMIPFSKRFVN